MAAPNSGSGFVWGPGITVTVSGSVPTTYSSGLIGSTGIVTAAVDVTQMAMLSFQTKLTSSAASVTVDIQVSNVPALRDNYLGATGPNSAIPAVRDDSYASVDWITLSTNTMAATTASRMDVVAYVPQRVARVRLTSAGATTAGIIYVRTQGWGS